MESDGTSLGIHFYNFISFEEHWNMMQPTNGPRWTIGRLHEVMDMGKPERCWVSLWLATASEDINSMIRESFAVDRKKGTSFCLDTTPVMGPTWYFNYFQLRPFCFHDCAVENS